MDGVDDTGATGAKLEGYSFTEKEIKFKNTQYTINTSQFYET